MGRQNQITFIVLQVYTFINMFTGRALSFYQYKNHKAGHILHTGSLGINALLPDH